MYNQKNIIIIVFSLFLIFVKAPLFALNFNLIGSISEIYDDNINTSETNPEYDLITNIMLGFGVNHEGRSQNLLFIGHVYQEIFLKNNEKNINSQDFDLQYSLFLSPRNKVQLNNKFEHYPEPKEFGDTFGRAADRDGYFRNNFNFAYSRQFIRRFSGILQYSNQVTKNKNDALIDSKINEGEVKATYYWSSINITSALYNIIKTEYENSEFVTDQRGSIIHRLFFTKQLYISLNLGYQYIKTSQDNEIKNVPMEISIADDVDKKNTIILTYIREYSATPNSDEVFENWRITGELLRQVSRRFNFFFSIFWGKGRYTPSDIVNKLIGLKTFLSYAFTENIQGKLEYSYLYVKKEMSSIEIAKYDRNKISFALEAKF
jgi:hypothetical protein